MKNIFKIIITFSITLFSIYLFANTTRDIGQEPDLSRKLISKWIIFYTNIERIKNGLAPLQYDPELEQAAIWQSEYCAKIQNLDHTARVKDMHTVKDRIEHFGARCGNCGENLTVKFSINSEGVPHYIKNDEKGNYFDFGRYTIYWRSEQQMGYSMTEGWMKSPGHRKNILHPGFMWIGAGATKGVYSNNKAYYGCQVFNGYGGLPHDSFTAKYELSGMEVKKRGKDAYIISYTGAMEAGVIEVQEDRELKSYPLDKGGQELVFATTKKTRTKGLLFASLYDKNLDMLYPVIMLK